MSDKAGYDDLGAWFGMSYAGRLYLWMICAENHPEQEPDWRFAKRWHLLWFVVPMLGPVLFVVAVQDAARRHEQ